MRRPGRNRKAWRLVSVDGEVVGPRQYGIELNEAGRRCEGMVGRSKHAVTS